MKAPVSFPLTATIHHSGWAEILKGDAGNIDESGDGGFDFATADFLAQSANRLKQAKTALTAWLEQTPEDRSPLRDDIQRVLDIVTLTPNNPDSAAKSEAVADDIDAIKTAFDSEINNLADIRWKSTEGQSMSEFKLPFQSVDCVAGKFAVSGNMDSLGSGILSYHTNYHAASENAKAINDAGGTAEVESVEQALGKVETINTSVGHYKWLDKHLDSFWQAVFGKSLNDTLCAGIVSAHGDKGYGYMRTWAEAGICFPHGMAIYLLTYTDEMDEEKFHSKEWVIKNFPRYRELLPNIDLNDEEILRPF